MPINSDKRQTIEAEPLTSSPESTPKKVRFVKK